MKIAITSQGKNLNADIDPRFGRCSYIIIFDTETQDYETLENTGKETASGAGIQTAQLIADKNVQVILTGNIGPKAFQALSAANTTIYTGKTGSVNDIITRFQNGDLSLTDKPTVESHAGIQDISSHPSEKTNTLKIAVAVESNQGLDSMVSPHFGRCPYYVLVYIQGKTVTRTEIVQNPFFNAHGQPGKVPSFIHDQNANVIIAGGMGQRAVGFFDKFGIEVITGVAGKAGDVIQGYVSGAISGFSPCKHDSCGVHDQ
jgi:predicted Fe-Mo cluster-binding NifX family protein